MGFRLVPISPAQITPGPLPGGVTVPVGQVTSGQIAGLFTVGSPAGPRAEIGTNAGGESGIRLYSDATTKTVTMDAATGNATFNNVTVKGVLRLPSAYQARMTDLLVDPSFSVAGGSYVEFGTAEWDRPTFQTFSNSALVQVVMEGYNNNTLLSTLRLTHRVYSGPSANGPWTLEVDFSTNNGAVVTNNGVGSTSGMQGSYATVHADLITSQTPTLKALTTDLANRPWIQIRPGWRISSGSAATSHFYQARLIVVPSE